MERSVLTSSLCATRFAQKPISMPSYSLTQVPSASRDLNGSTLQYIEDREHFQACMAEMLLVCKEALRRRPPGGKGTGTKPLSLEYIADRVDIDDPLFGYMIRTEENKNDAPNWKRGMLQGFITLTTFTNYHKQFKWDSLNEAAYVLDDDELAIQRVTGERKWDHDGSLAFQLQSSIRYGDIWNEGIVWPRIAEIGLLGALGCGRTLISLVIEELECMKATGKANYDYVVLQATDNSIPFYESMGFVRVGAIMQDNDIDDERSKSKQQNDDDEQEIVAEPVEDDSPDLPNAIARSNDIVISDVFSYTTLSKAETPRDIANKFNVDVWDIIFLNKHNYEGLSSSSKLLLGTILHVPKKLTPPSNEAAVKDNADLPKWYVAREDDTPRFIAKKFKISCLDLVNANKERLPGLIPSSRLRAGTRVKVSHLGNIQYDFKPYAHWSFPDDKFEEGEPSYMMARKLHRKRGVALKRKPFQESLAIKVSNHEPPLLLLPPSPPRTEARQSFAPSTAPSYKKLRQPHPDEPKSPKRPPCAFMLFAVEQRKSNQVSKRGTSKSYKCLWEKLAESEKRKYVQAAREAKEQYLKDHEEYEKELHDFYASHPELQHDCAQQLGFDEPASEMKPKQSLFNKVVRLKPGSIVEESEYEYWYVLTFIPDLKWCHLAPMVTDGVFGPEKPKYEGRPKWKLIDEELGKEIDISSSFCIPIKSKATKKTMDADKEEWDIIDDGIEPDFDPDDLTSANSSHGSIMDLDDWSVESTKVTSSLSAKKNVKPNRSSGKKEKPSEQKRKRLVGRSNLPTLVACHPTGAFDVKVRLMGSKLRDPKYDYTRMQYLEQTVQVEVNKEKTDRRSQLKKETPCAKSHTSDDDTKTSSLKGRRSSNGCNTKSKTPVAKTKNTSDKVGESSETTPRRGPGRPCGSKNRHSFGGSRKKKKRKREAISSTAGLGHSEPEVHHRPKRSRYNSKNTVNNTEEVAVNTSGKASRKTPREVLLAAFKRSIPEEYISDCDSTVSSSEIFESHVCEVVEPAACDKPNVFCPVEVMRSKNEELNIRITNDASSRSGHVRSENGVESTSHGGGKQNRKETRRDSHTEDSRELKDGTEKNIFYGLSYDEESVTNSSESEVELDSDYEGGEKRGRNRLKRNVSKPVRQARKANKSDDDDDFILAQPSAKRSWSRPRSTSMATENSSDDESHDVVCSLSPADKRLRARNEVTRSEVDASTTETEESDTLERYLSKQSVSSSKADDDFSSTTDSGKSVSSQGRNYSGPKKQITLLDFGFKKPSSSLLCHDQPLAPRQLVLLEKSSNGLGPEHPKRKAAAAGLLSDNAREGRHVSHLGARRTVLQT